MALICWVPKIFKHRDTTDILENQKSFPGQHYSFSPRWTFSYTKLISFPQSSLLLLPLSFLQWTSEKNLALPSSSCTTAFKSSLSFPLAGSKSPVHLSTSMYMCSSHFRDLLPGCCLWSGLSVSCLRECKTEPTFGQWAHMWLQDSQAEGSNPFPWSAGCVLASAIQYVVSASSPWGHVADSCSHTCDSQFSYNEVFSVSFLAFCPIHVFFANRFFKCSSSYCKKSATRNYQLK